MTASELRDLTREELESELTKLQREYFVCRMQRATEQLPQVHLIKQARRDIARVKTVLKEKANG